MADPAPGARDKPAPGPPRRPVGPSKRRAEPFLWLLPQGLRRIVESEGRGCVVLLAVPLALAAATLALVYGLRLVQS